MRGLQPAPDFGATGRPATFRQLPQRSIRILVAVHDRVAHQAPSHDLLFEGKRAFVAGLCMQKQNGPKGLTVMLTGSMKARYFRAGCASVAES